MPNLSSTTVKHNSGKGTAGGARMQDDTVEIANGCACCSASEELLASIQGLADIAGRRQVPWDQIVIETIGAAKPKEVRENLRTTTPVHPEMMCGTSIGALFSPNSNRGRVSRSRHRAAH